ncbi:MAG: diaminopimelate epimerase [Arenicellales bacterium]|jgi:diaminopimelate epimerase|nr:diaminopimelate epimerase [Arenicellales bacterium]MDP6791728.1 diaminopimelate epimerase [Arenicellales bacterium]MDP6919447.1 diaminopimelate epimerase [Arenicellales bacterium]|tara:strand:+ start:14509 stop:15315 length:807 start_codon:yes stop_codon:yes gene_type:complete
MHSLGNDFVMLDGVSAPIALSPEAVRNIADRHRGIGCDQLIVAEPCADGADFFMRIYNTDGSESGQCGNGARCLSRFVREQGLTEKQTLEIETISTRFTLSLGTKGQVSAELAAPVFEPQKIPFRAGEMADGYSVSVGGQTFRIGAVSVGNPHAVLLVDDIDNAGVAEIGPAIEYHPDFPERTNVGFVQIEDRAHLKLRVWERGVGETLACGSGACAAVSVCRRWELIDDSVSVTLPGGTLALFWPGSGPVRMSGPTERVFDGLWSLE